jgi:hypothetical protein
VTVTATDPLFADDFETWVWGPGYQILPALVMSRDGSNRMPVAPERVIVPVYDPGFLDQKTVQPLKNAHFFRELGQCDTSDEGLRSFAHRYGLLGIARTVVINSGGDAPPVPSFGERTDDWRDEILTLRTTTRAWDAYQQRDLPALKTMLDRAGRFEHQLLSRSRLNPNEDQATRVLVVRDSPVLPEDRSLGPVVRLIPMCDSPQGTTSNTDPWEGVRATLLREINTKIGEHCRPELTAGSSEREYAKIRVRPTNLLGAAWWQLGRLVVGMVSYHPCRVCGTPFILRREGVRTRSDREFCTAACKAKDHRDRVKMARTLKAQAKSIPEIARTVGSDPKTVRRWVLKTK